MSFRNILPSRNKVGTPATQQEVHPILALHQEMNQLFDHFFKGWNLPETPLAWPNIKSSLGTDFTPRVNVSEDEKSVCIEAELPGIEQKDLNLTLHDGVLTLKGEKKVENEEKKKEFHRIERSSGSFQRAIALPCEVKEDQINASFKNGVLKVVCPKSEEAQKKVKHIEIHN